VTQKRKTIPKDIKDKLLVDSMHRCCLCPQHEDITQFHHIEFISEGGPDTEDNLVVVCATCHDKIHRIRGMYTPEQLQMYKERWVNLCAQGVPLEERIRKAPGIEEPELKTAHILFLDIVGYSKLKANQQVKAIDTLNRIVESVIASLPLERRLALPTGDGMAIAFLENPESPLLAACRIAPKVMEAGIPLRMGMHIAPVYVVKDIKQEENIVGDGINLAQRVMDCGDAGHILASKAAAEALRGVKEEYERLFHDLGVFEVKHGVEIEIWNVFGEEFGNPTPPKRKRKPSKIPLPLEASLNNQPPPEPNFVGRAEMLKIITEWYNDPEVRIGALIGWGGVGKSALVRKWYDSLGKIKIRPDGIFWWGFYRNAYLEPFLNALLRYVSQGQIDPDTIKSPWEKTDKIKEYISKGAYLIILDGLEQMQKAESGDEFGKMVHRECTELLHYLADSPGAGLCLVTTRYPMKDLESWRDGSYKMLSLIDLGTPDALAMLRKRGVKGDDERLKEVIEKYKGHALSLTSVVGFVKRYHNGDITKAPDVKFVFGDKERFKDVNKLLRKYADKMSEPELVFLNIFSLFRGEVTEKEFAGVFRHKIQGAKFNDVLVKMNELDFKDLVDGLVDWRLISYDETKKSYTTHPLIKTYFETAFYDEDKKLCHKRIYQYFGEHAPERPETLEKMQPLFEQVYHGCSAGLYDEVAGIYWEKISKKDQYFLVNNLGGWETDLSLIRNFFPEGDLSQLPLLSKKSDQSWLLNSAGLTLLATGQIKGAEQAFFTALQMAIATKEWENVSGGYHNLAELQFRVGEIEKGLKSARSALVMAKRAGSDWNIVVSKAYLGQILRVLGKNREAEKWFREADQLERKISGNRLYSLRGVAYADFLISIRRLDEAFELTRQNLKICKDEIWPDHISRCHRCLGTIERIKGNSRKAEVHLQKALELARKVGMPFLEIEALLEYGRLYLEKGEYKNAINSGNEVLKICQRTGFLLYEPDAEVVVARACLAQKNFKQAKTFANSTLLKAKKMGYKLAEDDALKVLKEMRT
jgi:tetratricopeptide (TPR) repeat protein/class 3 adenylate cyclase